MSLWFTSQDGYLISLGTKGSGPQECQGPRGITIDKSGLVYVYDNCNDRVQIF